MRREFPTQISRVDAFLLLLPEELSAKMLFLLRERNQAMFHGSRSGGYLETGHPMAPQFQAARVVVEDLEDPITRGLGPERTMTEEWYWFAASSRLKGAHVLHRRASYSEPHSLALLEQGIARAAGLGETRCVAGRERPRAPASSR